MYAIVCDLCGKTTLLSDKLPLDRQREDTVMRLKLPNNEGERFLGICDECTEKLLEAFERITGSESLS